MKEAYVSFETAKLLKDRWFNGYCHVVHISNHNSLIGKVINNTELTITHEYKFCRDQENCVTIPTQQMACDWVEKTYGFFIEISRSRDRRGNYHYFYMILDKACRYASEATKDNDYPSKYEAIEAALLYVLTNFI